MNKEVKNLFIYNRFIYKNNMFLYINNLKTTK
jgi:hypothetical protein